MLALHRFDAKKSAGILLTSARYLLERAAELIEIENRSG
jgi:hypothetical protein